MRMIDCPAPPTAARAPLAALLPLLAATLALFLGSDVSVDYWWHLETGRRILSGEGIPGPDPFLYTSRGAEWLDLHWLFQVVVAALHESVGFEAVVLFKAALVFSAIALALRVPGPARPSPGLAVLLSLLGIAVFTLRTGLRPEHVSYAILAAEVVLLESARYLPGRPLRLLGLPLLQLAWTNVQGIFVLGIALQAAYLGGEAAARVVARRRGPDAPPAYSPAALAMLGAATALSIGAAFANPYGARGALHPFELLTRLDPSSGLFQTISELRPTLSFEFAPAATAAFVALIAAGGAGAFLRPLWSPSLALAGTGLAVLAAGAYRNAPLLPLVAIPLALHGLSPVLLRRARTAAAGFAALLLAAIAADAARPGVLFFPFLAVESPSLPSAPAGAEAKKAADFLERTGFGSRLFSSSDDASFFAYRFRGEKRSFMDTRTEVVPEMVFGVYHAILERPGEVFDAVAAKDGIDAVVVNMRRPKMARLLHHLLGSKEYALAFAEEGEMVFIRRGAPNAETALAESLPPGAADEIRRRYPEPANR